MADLPPVARRWRQLHEKLARLRGSLRKHPKTHPHWDRWYSQADQLLQLRKQLIQPMHAAGFRVHRRGGTPLSSVRELQQERFLETTEREHHRATYEFESEVWEAFSAGWDPDSLPRVTIATPDTAHNSPLHPAASSQPWQRIAT